MAIKTCISDIDVVKAARKRIINVFSNGLTVYMSFSGGKDSLCLANLVVDLINEGRIDKSRLRVIFIDEEAIFPCIDEMVRKWRLKFLAMGVPFYWYCLEVRHFNCFNQLENDESFICWDSTKADRWVRQPPSFAIRSHPMLKPREDTYQMFLGRLCANGINLIGIRAAESFQRRQYLAFSFTHKKAGENGRVFPIYDWKNNDVWLYLYRNKIDIPEVYLFMYQTGRRKNDMRISQFFSVDTAKVLVNMNEYYPNLMDSVIRREPNAYLAALYWDSEMFGKSTRARSKMEGKDNRDYKQAMLDLFANFDENFDTPHKRMVAQNYRKLFFKAAQMATNREFKKMYDGLISGDPKMRTLRSLYTTIFTSYVKKAKQENNIQD